MNIKQRKSLVSVLLFLITALILLVLAEVKTIEWLPNIYENMSSYIVIISILGVILIPLSIMAGEDK